MRRVSKSAYEWMDELIVARATRKKDVIAKVINGTLIFTCFNHFAAVAAVVAAPVDVQCYDDDQLQKKEK